MEKSEFIYRLFNLLNEHGEEEIALADMEIHDAQDQIVVEISDGTQFAININQT